MELSKKRLRRKHLFLVPLGLAILVLGALNIDKYHPSPLKLLQQLALNRVKTALSHAWGCIELTLIVHY